jgi:predicted RNase H-like HicB family nuclease
MAIKFILSEYIALALDQATYDKLEDGTFAGRIPSCPGVIAFADTLRRCEEELRSTLEDWILVGLKMGHPLPVIDNVNLNQEPWRESMEAM